MVSYHQGVRDSSWASVVCLAKVWSNLKKQTCPVTTLPFLSSYRMSDIMLPALWVLYHLIYITTLEGRYCYYLLCQSAIAAVTTLLKYWWPTTTEHFFLIHIAWGLQVSCSSAPNEGQLWVCLCVSSFWDPGWRSSPYLRHVVLIVGQWKKNAWAGWTL